MNKFRRPDESKDLFTYFGEEVKCDCGFRAARLMTLKFEKYFNCPFYKCRFEKKLEVVLAENSVRREMRATMEAKLAEKDAEIEVVRAELAHDRSEWQRQRIGIIRSKDRYIEAITEDLKDTNTKLRRFRVV